MSKNTDAEELPTQWTKVDKNEFQRTEQAVILPGMREKDL